MGYSPWGHKELDMTKQLSLSHTHTHTYPLRWGDDPGLCRRAHTVTRVFKSEREREGSQRRWGNRSRSQSNRIAGFENGSES